MTSKERLRTTLAHRQPDRVPIDFGGTSVTGIHVSCVSELRDYYGLEKRLVKAHEPYQMLGQVDDDLKEAMGLDVAGVCPRKTMFGYPNENWKPWRLPSGLEVLIPESFAATTDTNGDILVYPEGDTSVPPSARMPFDGHFFDAIVRQQPFDEDNPNVEDNLEEFAPVPEADLEYFARSVEEAAAGGRAVIANFGGMGFGDIALVPAPFLKHPRGIRDVAEWYMSTRTRQDFIHKVFSFQCEIALQNLQRIHAAVGNAVDAAFICGTDFGTQTSSFCSVETLQRLYCPYYKRLNDWIHGHTTWKTFKHSCGSVERFINSFIKAGFDILNPVQCSAAGMAPEHLKSTYGERIVFWGGGVDTQRVLPFGSPAEVRQQVLRRCEVFSKDGGFVFNTIHNIQAQTPVENIVAMIDAVREFNGASYGAPASVPAGPRPGPMEASKERRDVASCEESDDGARGPAGTEAGAP